ncbi:MAG: glycosyltransferase [Lachnospiraceae bacterium]|nr:glycosyltransferase [Lachnospiraceae bacterium]
MNPERFNTFNIKRGISYLKRNGVKKTCYKAIERLKRDNDEAGYNEAVMLSRPTVGELDRQRARSFFHNYKISILVPAYNTEPEYLKEMIASVVKQTYSNWELCIADGSDDDTVSNAVKEIRASSGKDTASKIKYQRLNANRGISGNSNGALVMATGDYVGMLDHDDLLSPNALYEVMDVLESGIERNGNIYASRYKAVYSDEDKVNAGVTRYFDYHRKPDFDIDFLRSNNYICHFFVVKTSVAVKSGGFRSEYNGAQDHDFIFRCIEQLEPSEIYHIPKVLYHWRSHISSTAENPDSKLYAYDAGKRAVRDHLKRLNIKAEVTDTPHLGYYRVKYEAGGQGIKTLSPQQWEQLTKQDLESIEEDFIMVLAPELKALNDNYLEELAGVLAREEVGAVGGKIYDSKGRIESAGYSYDEDGNLNPDYRGMNGNFSGYLHRASVQHKTDGLSKDCMMIKKAAIVFGEKATMSDKYITVYDPFAEFRRKRIVIRDR